MYANAYMKSFFMQGAVSQKCHWLVLALPDLILWEVMPAHTAEGGSDSGGVICNARHQPNINYGNILIYCSSLQRKYVPVSQGRGCMPFSRQKFDRQRTDVVHCVIAAKMEGDGLDHVATMMPPTRSQEQ